MRDASANNNGHAAEHVMKSDFELKSLIDALQSLYSRVVSFALNKRMDSYHEDSGSVAVDNLTTLLADHIDRLADSSTRQRETTLSQSSEREPPAANQNLPEEEGATKHQAGEQNEQRAAKELSMGRRKSGRRETMVGRTLSGLSRYLQSRRKESVLDPEMSDKLRKSTWTHIHTALRLARQGDARSAKLHLDIASQALREAAHYMSREDHIAFTVEVEEKLGEITDKDGGSSLLS